MNPQPFTTSVGDSPRSRLVLRKPEPMLARQGHCQPSRWKMDCPECDERSLGCCSGRRAGPES
jgi:hypothetical protein